MNGHIKIMIKIIPKAKYVNNIFINYSLPILLYYILRYVSSMPTNVKILFIFSHRLF